MDDEIDEALVLKNKDVPVRHVRHADLTPFDEGHFKRDCPACERGVLLVRRDQKTLALINTDICTLCSQRFVYIDKAIAGAPIQDASAPQSELAEQRGHS